MYLIPGQFFEMIFNGSKDADDETKETTTLSRSQASAGELPRISAPSRRYV
jgi:hypothetical protein